MRARGKALSALIAATSTWQQAAPALARSLTCSSRSLTSCQICLGQNQECDASATGPQDRKGSGFSISPGQKHAVTSDTPGTYEITCSVHPNMNLTVTMQ